MTELQLAHQIIQALDQQRKESPAPITVDQIVSAARLLYYVPGPEQSGESPTEIRQMAIELAAMCMRLILVQP